MKEQVAVYIRVSTDKQESENQLRQLSRYCEKSDWEIYKVYSDTISGKETTRPAYDQLYRDAHKKLFDGILFWSLDRFSRSGTLFTLQKLKELTNLGIWWHSYQDRFISTAGEWKDVIISIMATLAKIERERISERTKAGLQRAKANGKQLGRSPIPRTAIKQVIELLTSDPRPSYREISRRVSYKGKHGKINHISPSMVGKIKKQFIDA